MNTIPQQPIWAVTPEKLAEAVRRIVAAAQPAQVILFGSQARGDAGRDSDVDLVVVETGHPNRYTEMVRLQRLLRDLILAVDILVIGEEEFAAWGDTPGSVYSAARREGKVLYEAA